MSWIQLEAALTNLSPEQVEHELDELGAVAVWLSDAADNPVLEPSPGSTPLWPATRIAALFPHDIDRGQLRHASDRLFGAGQARLETIADRDWVAEWETSLEPLEFGRKLCVVRHRDDPVPAERLRIVLKPGMAFGTGEHPTTAMCLEWLEGLGRKLADRSVLDYGCGSGLLAIAALKLGAAHAAAVDIDPQALAATLDNAAINDCASGITVLAGAEEDSAQYDVLVANILSNTLIECGPLLNSLTAPGAPLALSGVLTNQADQVIDAWADWAELAVTGRVDDWVLLSGIKFKVKKPDVYPVS